MTSPYWERALKSRDPRYARILSRLGYATLSMKAVPVVAEASEAAQEPAHAPEAIEPATGEISGPTNATQHDPEATDELSDLRAKYQEIIGKRPYHGWGADELRNRIDEALAS